MKPRIEMLDTEEKEQDPIGMQIVALTAQVAEYEREIKQLEKSHEAKDRMIKEQEKELARLRSCVYKWQQIAQKAQRERDGEWECIIDTERRKDGR